MTDPDETSATPVPPEGTAAVPTDESSGRVSGLSNPERAIRAMGAGVMALEALALLLAIVPLRILEVEPIGPVVGFVLVLTALCLVLAARMSRRWAWTAGGVVQAVLVAAGLWHWSLAGIGLVFGLTWIYALSVRRRLARPPVRDADE